MLHELVNRVKHWSIERITTEVYKNLAITADISQRFVTEIIDDGIFLTHEGSCTFFQTNTGRIFRLDKYFQAHDWQAQVALYKLSRDKFSMDEPINSAVLTIGNHQYRYSIYQRAGTNIGLDLMIDVGKGKVTKEYIKEFIDQSIIVLETIKSVTVQENIPWTDKAIWLTSRINIDGVYSWKTFIRWTKTADFVYNNSLNQLISISTDAFIMQNQLFNTNYSKTDVNECADYARKKWKPAIY